MLLNLFLLVLGFFLLVKGADSFVDGAANLATKFGIPQLIVGLTIVAMGTSLPEAAISITAATKGSAGITVGNVIGSNILNVLIILGITAVITNVAIQESTLRIELPFMLGISALLIVFGITGNAITLPEGIALCVLFILFLAYLFVMAKKGKADIEEAEECDFTVLQCLLHIVAGAVMIVFGSDFTIDGATAIARSLGMSERFIGLTIVALGTSLPELVTSVTAATKGKADIAIGNIVGSNIFNILFVIGITGLITTIPFEPKFMIDGLISIGAGLLLWLGTFRTKELRRPVGCLMLLAYAGYFVYLCMK